MGFDPRASYANALRGYSTFPDVPARREPAAAFTSSFETARAQYFSSSGELNKGFPVSRE